VAQKIQPSPSMLVYLFADRIFQQGERAKWKTMVPCKEDVTVAAKDLAAGLLTVSFWNLREQRLIRFEPSQKQTLFVGSSPALRIVKVNHIEQNDFIGRIALESLILTSLSDHEDDDVSNLLKQHLLVPGAWPEVQLYEQLIGMPAKEALIFGYIENSRGEDPVEVRKPVTLGRVGSGPLRLAEGLEPRCEKIAALEGRFDDFALRMQSFQTAEAEIYALLLDECAGAIERSITNRDLLSDSDGGSEVYGSPRDRVSILSQPVATPGGLFTEMRGRRTLRS
jgi:hypothetical protein